ncbi:MAG: sulfatase [Bacteroidota bacterium]
MRTLKLFGLLILLGSVPVGLTSCEQEETQEKVIGTAPNIIYIMADDMTTQALSIYENGIYDDIAPTPNMDRLAKEGMLFQNVMCTNAICGPSRAAILTGDYSHVNGYYKNHNGGQFDTAKWTFPQAFQQNGYQTSLFGKWHLGSEPVGFDEFKFHVEAGQQGLYWDPVYNHNGERVKEEGYATNLTTDFALDWLGTKRDQEKPFLMLLQYKAPHRAWEPDKKYETLWDDIEMPYPDNFDDDYEGRELTMGDTDMTMDFLSRVDMKMTPPEDLSPEELLRWRFYGVQRGEIVDPEGLGEVEGRKWRYQKYIKDYLACVKSVDDNIGRVIDYLEENGLSENTMIVLTADQGFYLGEHNFFDKRFIYEESLRMPFIVRYPRHVQAGSMNEDVIANVDFAPTLLDVAGIQTAQEMHGRSFASALEGNTPADWRQSIYYHYYEFPFWHHVQPHYGIRTDKYTLAHFYYSIDVWELYDLEKDPSQMNNVIDDPAYAEVVEELKAQMTELQATYGEGHDLAAYREISDTNFGTINGRAGNLDDVLENDQAK